MQEDQKKVVEGLRKSLQISVVINIVTILLVFTALVLQFTIGFPRWEPEKWFADKGAANPYDITPRTETDSNTLVISQKLSLWEGKNADLAPANDTGDLIRYGRNLIAHTAAYLGPKGTVAQVTNGLNCQNCHLDAGTRIWGNNYGAVASTYPKLRARSGQVENVYKRISDCMERSLNGTALPVDNREMKAMEAYITWLGQGVPAKVVPNGVGIAKLPYLTRAADPDKGAAIYQAKCASCHGTNGAGVLAGDGRSYTYPPLWGSESYNTGAGLFRLSRFAGYVKNNMPFGVTYKNTQLSDEECWDLAAFVNTRPRPSKNLSSDWPDISKKPVDHPFGPYSDGFSEKQHKFGPFDPIEAARKSKSNTK